MDYVDKLHIKPFLSILLGMSPEATSAAETHEKISSIIRTEGRKEQVVNMHPVRQDSSGEALIFYTHYEVLKNPSWFSGNILTDIENHIFITFNLNNTFAFYVSEKGLKDEIRTYFFTPLIPNIKVINISQLNYLFINEDNIKMLWLLGTHGRESFKADSKVLGGESVADTLNPLEDQSFVMSAVRTSLDGTEKTIGLNPYKSSLWRGPCKDWKTFENRVIEIIDTIDKNKNEVENPISILATPIAEMKGVSNVYDLSFLDPEFNKNDLSESKVDRLHTIKNKYTFKIFDTLNSPDISLEIFKNLISIGEIKISPKILDYSVEFDVIEKIPKKGKKPELDYFANTFKYPELIKCWYESGHAIINSRVFKTEYRDVIYNNFIWANFDNFDISKEKPELNGKAALNKIGTQKSLFCWMKHHWCGLWDSHENFMTTDKPSGWLFCDDGAGEKADFIHIDEHKDKVYISLIHIKAANSNSCDRRISVGAHDIVLNQAIKNLRYISRKNLTTDLRERAENAIAKYCWNNNVISDHGSFITAIEALEKNSKIKFRVIIVQPHTMKSYYDKNVQSNIRKQLDVLLVSAESAIRASGAEFYIIGHDDGKN
ncbi:MULTISPECIES: hypothetical protein [Pantoea]|uniref:Uncharacterized protein n=1 Tax=Candidatus Pantoea gossypiicola TaxID=2608008 RepID=A0AB34CDE1_9GAMM|nr:MULTISPECIES: hypothetical protein [Pantoea]KAA5923580.1 hypothetical protein F3I59_20310 [Pantoea sp. VH_8]KAA5929551.1 hypothetical protein F3I58_20530 [Pantoea sp. VH_4]KAA5981397.1 hypothetical protein F3I49_19730 [Pantoea sp. M_4]KAA6120135.1 hypothetical protein F3I20_20360 [Pantoea gossypiicola]